MSTQDPDMPTSLCVSSSESVYAEGLPWGRRQMTDCIPCSSAVLGEGQMLLSVYKPQSDDRADTKSLDLHRHHTPALGHRWVLRTRPLKAFFYQMPPLVFDTGWLSSRWD